MGAAAADASPRMVRNMSMPVLHTAQRASLARVSSFSRMAFPPPPYAPPPLDIGAAVVPEHEPRGVGGGGASPRGEKPSAWAVRLVRTLGGARGEGWERYLFLAGLSRMCALPAGCGLVWLGVLGVPGRVLGVATVAVGGMLVSPRLVDVAGVAWGFAAFAMAVMVLVVLLTRYVGVAILVWMSIIPWAAAGSLGSQATVIVSVFAAGVVVAVGGKEGGMGIGGVGVFAAWLLFLGCVAVVQTHISLVVEVEGGGKGGVWRLEEQEVGSEDGWQEKDDGNVPEFGMDKGEVLGGGLLIRHGASPRRRVVSARLPPRSPMQGLGFGLGR